MPPQEIVAGGCDGTRCRIATSPRLDENDPSAALRTLVAMGRDSRLLTGSCKSGASDGMEVATEWGPGISEPMVAAV